MENTENQINCSMVVTIVNKGFASEITEDCPGIRYTKDDMLARYSEQDIRDVYVSSTVASRGYGKISRLEEIMDYCLEQGFRIDVDRLFDYYSSKGWKIGNSPMKDWKAAVRNWARRDKEQPARSEAPVKRVVAQQYEQRDYGDEDSEAMQRQIEMIRRMNNGRTG